MIAPLIVASLGQIHRCAVLIPLWEALLYEAGNPFGCFARGFVLPGLGKSQVFLGKSIHMLEIALRLA